MDILRFITAGSVDDGKSTLIGRLLYDTNSIFDDQLVAIERASKNLPEGQVDLSLLTDGLRAEREQGITIDVAYKYFNTPKRKFIIADSPGHIQYTRNMVTGASNSTLAVILVDARNGVIEQNPAATPISAICLGLPHVVVCINKMDLEEYSEERYKQIISDYNELSKGLNMKDVTFIPVSALMGDNVVKRSNQMAWYDGPTLIEKLEGVKVEKDINHTHPRFQVQYVIRPKTDEHHDYRGYAGRIFSGQYKKGDSITILPEYMESKLKAIEIGQEEVEEATAPHSAVLHLEDDIDISRGDMLVPTEELPEETRSFTANMCWMDNRPMQVGGKYLLQHNSRTVKVVLDKLNYKLDINTMEQLEEGEKLKLNDVGKVTIRSAQPLFFDPYITNRQNGSFILIDERNYNTVAAGMVEDIN